jgi:HlyD family secretion protein
MIPRRSMSWRLNAVIALLAGTSACGSPDRATLQGYVEGEFVYVASPLAGALETLHVRRGRQVDEGAALFDLDDAPQKAARDEAQRRLNQAQANWEDTTKGKRPSEIAAIEAELERARAALEWSERELVRLRKLLPSRATTVSEVENAQSRRDQEYAQVRETEANLHTARLGARSDQIAAALAEVHAREAALAQADWDLGQMRQAAPKAGLVFDTLYREGEWVAAGRPVVALLPPANIKVRAFVPEGRIAAVRLGQSARVTADGLARGFEGTVAYISPRAEYTPPVIYSRESRSKLVFMIEILFEPAAAAALHPGQPVDVELLGSAP